MLRFDRFRSKNSTLVRLSITVLVILVIAGIWFFKNQKRTEDQAESLQDPIFALHVRDTLDIDKLRSHGLPLIIDFGADSCLPCKEMAPVLKELNESLQGKAIIKFVDVWKYQDLAEGFPLRVIPTQFFFDKDGKPFLPSDPENMQMTIYKTKDNDTHVFTVHEGGMTKSQLLAVLEELGVLYD